MEVLNWCLPLRKEPWAQVQAMCAVRASRKQKGNMRRTAQVLKGTWAVTHISGHGSDRPTLVYYCTSLPRYLDGGARML
jgi:hypothetical protein